jgi:hypothetical protein
MGRIEKQHIAGRPLVDLPDEVDTPRATDGPGALGQTDAVEHERAAAEADARHERMDRVAVLYGEITAATREFLRAIAECDRHRDWAQEGFASCADWLAWRIGVTRNVAGEKIRAARALESLPLISDAMARGQISFSKVRALTRAATPDNEAELLEYARAASAASLERLVRGWKTLGRVDEARAERLRHRMRSFSVFPNNEGMFVVKGVVTPEVGALLQRAIEAAGDALFSASAADDGQRQEPDQLRADALALVAERALAAGFGRGHAAEEAPISGSRAERYQVILHVEPESLTEHGEPGMCELEDGSRLSAESARRLACDAGLVAVARGDEGGAAASGGTPAGAAGAGVAAGGRVAGGGGVEAGGRGAAGRGGAADGGSGAAAGECAHCRALDLGRKTRTVPPSVRRALGARDGGCRFPGCRLRFTDAHHIVHWADGGETELHNLILLCARHHRAVHEGGFRVCTDKDAVAVFFSPSGRVIAEAPAMPGLEADPLERLVARNRAHGSAPDWRSGRQEWRRDEDVPWEIEAAALEAMDRVYAGGTTSGSVPGDASRADAPDGEAA